MKRKLKSAVCLGLSALAMMSCISGVSAANTDTIMSSRTITVDPSQVSDDFLVLSGASSNEQDLKDAAAAIAQGAAEFKEKIDISKYNIRMADDMILYDYLRYEYPELINLNHSFFYSGTSGIITYYEPSYRFSIDEKDKYLTPLNAKIDEIVAEAQRLPNDFLKALFVHDYIIENCKYATEVINGSATPSDFVYDAYGCLVEKRCVCQGYSMAYKAVMKKLSIPVSFAHSDEMNHIWNTVTIDGKTYHADLTWDDPLGGGRHYVGHSNFLCTDEEITDTGHKSWTTSSTISENSFPNRFWEDTTTKIAIYGDEIFYTTDVQSNVTRLKRYNTTTGKTSTIRSSLTGANWMIWSGCMSKIVLIDDVIYYSLPDGINAIRVDGSDDQSVYTLSIYGEIDDFYYEDGKFYGEIYNYTDKTSKYMELTLSEFKRSVIPGDVNEDGVVTMLDAILTQKYALSFFTPDENVKKAADVNGDGVISVYDALIIQKRALAM
ncbi:MAG: dockerin type I domain-containing protein [Acutalibacteraceae bacterium]